MYPNTLNSIPSAQPATLSKALDIRSSYRAEESSWSLSPLASTLRSVVQLPLFTILDMLAPDEVYGVESLEGLSVPVIFAANHTSHLDSLAVLKALPEAWSRKVAVAAATDYFFTNPWLGKGVALAFNAFPFCRTTSAHRSIQQCTWLLDQGWSVLLFPEGTRSSTGEIGTFKAGAGLLAVKLSAPVVPIYIDGLFQVLPKGQTLPRPGRISVKIGQPLAFKQGISYGEAAVGIEQAVRSLSTQHEWLQAA